MTIHGLTTWLTASVALQGPLFAIFAIPGDNQAFPTQGTTVLDPIVFRKGFSPWDYGPYRTYSANGRSALLVYNYERFHVEVKYEFRTNDLVGIQGGIYRVFSSNSATLRLVKEEDRPKGLKPPAIDSFTIPFQNADTVFARMSTRDAWTITRIDKRDAKAGGGLVATVRVSLEMKQEFATVKAGDYLIINHQGWLVRNVVAPDAFTRVAGWVEFSPDSRPWYQLKAEKKSCVTLRPKDKQDTKGK